MMKNKDVKITLQKFPPPLPLVWAFWPAGADLARQLHKVHYRAIWHSRGLFGAAELVVLLLLWPFLLAPRIRAATRRNGQMIQDRTGKGLWRQRWEQFVLAARFGFRPNYYYMMEFFRPEQYRQAGHYIHRYVVKDSLYRLLKDATISPLTGKDGFADYCLAHGLPVAPIIASLVDGRIVGEDFAGLPQADLFVKRTRGRGGVKAELWLYDQGGYRMRSGTRLDANAFMARLLELSRSEPYMIQKRQVNHADIADLSPGALATVRLVTAIDEQGGIEAVRAVFRMGVSAESIVDNFHAGGIAAPVDLATGELGRATDFGLAPSIGWVDRHPATGARITGRCLPQWQAIVALAQRAHGRFTDRAIIGWDIALTSDGLSIVEGNAAPDVDNIQRPHGTPLGQSRYAELMHWHLARLGRV